MTTIYSDRAELFREYPELEEEDIRQAGKFRKTKIFSVER